MHSTSFPGGPWERGCSAVPFGALPFEDLVISRFHGDDVTKGLFLTGGSPEKHHGRTFWRQKRKDKMADAGCNDQALEQGGEQTMDTEHPNTATETRTARLMITKIVNENFKSYAGTQELGPFHKVLKFTVVTTLIIS